MGARRPGRALVFANGNITDGPLLCETLADMADALLIAADGGAGLARARGLHVDVVIGDMDSLDAQERARLQHSGAQLLPHPPDKDETDLELALKWAARHACRCLRVCGALGGRLDQSLANVSLLALPQLRACDVRLVDGAQQAWLLRPGRHELTGQPGDTVSLLPLHGPARGIVSAGLRWELRDETLSPGPARGVSNLLPGTRADLRLREGLLLVVQTRGRA